MKDYKQLEDLSMFKELSYETVKDLEAAGQYLSMKKGSFCYRAGEAQDKVFFLLSGRAMIYTLTSEGNRKIIFVYGGGQLLTENLMRPSRTTVFCELMSDCRLFTVSNKALLAAMEKDFVLTKAIMLAQEKKLWRTSHQLKNTLGSIYLEKKLAAKLWKLARDFGVPDYVANPDQNQKVTIDFSLSITFLADFLGAPRETTSRIAKSLVERGLITMEKKKVTVLSMDTLSNFYKGH